MSPGLPLKRVAEIRFSNVDKKTVDGQIPVRLCNYTEVYYNDRISADMAFVEATATPEQIGRFTLHSGDVLLTKDSETADDIGVSAFVPDSLPGVLCGYHLAVVRPRPSIDGGFLRWALASTTARQQLEVAATGVTRFGLRLDAVGSATVPIPGLAAQRSIADYLDAETARVDLAVAALHRSLDLIAARRKSVLVSAFTRPSGLTRGATVRALADPLLGRQRSPDQAQGPHMVRYLRAANVKDGRLELNDAMEMNFAPNEQVAFALRTGDVVITEGAGSLAAVGANAVWHGELPGTVCFQNTLIRLRPRGDSDPRFVAWWARYAFESGLFAAAAGGANIYHLGVETVRGLPAWAPAVEVQCEVADHVDREVSRLERQAGLRQRQIELLLERRQALISAAVTGHLQIPGAPGDDR